MGDDGDAANNMRIILNEATGTVTIVTVRGADGQIEGIYFEHLEVNLTPEVEQALINLTANALRDSGVDPNILGVLFDNNTSETVKVSFAFNKDGEINNIDILGLRVDIKDPEVQQAILSLVSEKDNRRQDMAVFLNKALNNTGEISLSINGNQASIRIAGFQLDINDPEVRAALIRTVKGKEAAFGVILNHVVDNIATFAIGIGGNDKELNFYIKLQLNIKDPAVQQALQEFAGDEKAGYLGVLLSNAQNDTAELTIAIDHNRRSTWNILGLEVDITDPAVQQAILGLANGAQKAVLQSIFDTGAVANPIATFGFSIDRKGKVNRLNMGIEAIFTQETLNVLRGLLINGGLAYMDGVYREAEVEKWMAKLTPQVGKQGKLFLSGNEDGETDLVFSTAEGILFRVTKDGWLCRPLSLTDASDRETMIWIMTSNGISKNWYSGKGYDSREDEMLAKVQRDLLGGGDTVFGDTLRAWSKYRRARAEAADARKRFRGTTASAAGDAAWDAAKMAGASDEEARAAAEAAYHNAAAHGAFVPWVMSQDGQLVNLDAGGDFITRNGGSRQMRDQTVFTALRLLASGGTLAKFEVGASGFEIHVMGGGDSMNFSTSGVVDNGTLQLTSVIEVPSANYRNVETYIGDSLVQIAIHGVTAEGIRFILIQKGVFNEDKELIDGTTRIIFPDLLPLSSSSPKTAQNSQDNQGNQNDSREPNWGYDENEGRKYEPEADVEQQEADGLEVTISGDSTASDVSISATEPIGGKTLKMRDEFITDEFISFLLESPPPSQSLCRLMFLFFAGGGINPDDPIFIQWQNEVYSDVNFDTKDILIFIKDLTCSIANHGKYNHDLEDPKVWEVAWRDLKGFFSVGRSIVEQGGVCRDYALILNFMLGQNGIQSEVLLLPGHAVVLVNVSGIEYIADPTPGNFGMVLPYDEFMEWWGTVGFYMQDIDLSRDSPNVKSIGSFYYD